jgi:GntR family transcriptional regulator
VFERIDPRSPVPLYSQIAQAVRGAVAAGALRAGDGLPSVRTLAAELRVNPATVVQAYRELESEMLIEMRQGAGTFVREVPVERREQERLREFRGLVRRLLDDAARLGIAPEAAASILRDEVTRGTA